MNVAHLRKILEIINRKLLYKYVSKVVLRSDFNLMSTFTTHFPRIDCAESILSDPKNLLIYLGPLLLKHFVCFFCYKKIVFYN